MDVPRTRYARNGPVHLAYQVVGEGPRDLIFITSWIAAIEHLWSEPRVATALRRLAAFSRLILFDRRGSGMSDRLPFAALEEQMDDLRAVLAAAGAPRPPPPPGRAAGAPRANLLEESEGAALACLFAATYPEQVESVALYSPIARFESTADYGWGYTPEQREAWIESNYWRWGEGDTAHSLAPSLSHDPAFVAWCARLERLAS